MSEYSIYTIIITTLVLLYYINEHKKNNISNITKYFLKTTLFILFTLLIYDNLNLFLSERSPTETAVIALGGAAVANHIVQSAVFPNSQQNIVSNTTTLVRESFLLVKYLSTVILSNSLNFTGHLSKSRIPMIAGLIGATVLFLNQDKIYENTKKILRDSRILSTISTLLAIFHPNPATRISGVNRILY